MIIMNITKALHWQHIIYVESKIQSWLMDTYMHDKCYNLPTYLVEHYVMCLQTLYNLIMSNIYINRYTSKYIYCL